MIKKIILEDNWEFIGTNRPFRAVYGIGDNRATYAGPNEEIEEGKRAYKILKLSNSTLFRVGSFLDDYQVNELINDEWKVVVE